MDMPTTNNDFTNTTQSALNLVDLNNDVLTLICSHLNMRDACCLYRTGCREMIEAIANTKFDFFTDLYDSNYSTISQRIPRFVSVKKFRSVFTSAIGIQITDPYELTDEDFDYMVPKNLQGKPLENVRISLRINYIFPIFIGDSYIPQKLYKKKYHKNAFKKLKGIHTLDISKNPLVHSRHLKSLKGIKYLMMDFCRQFSESALRHLKKVEYLYINRCPRMTDNALAYLKSDNLKFLFMDGCTQMTDNALAYLKSDNLISLSMDGCTQMTDNALTHLKSGKLKELSCRGCELITIDAIQEFSDEFNVLCFYDDPNDIDPEDHYPWNNNLDW
jgi:Leucine-rich repeat (LRR) protein